MADFPTMRVTRLNPMALLQPNLTMEEAKYLNMAQDIDVNALTEAAQRTVPYMIPGMRLPMMGQKSLQPVVPLQKHGPPSFHEDIVLKGGGKYLGTQKGKIYYIDPETNSVTWIEARKATPKRIQAKLSEMKKFDEKMMQERQDKLYGDIMKMPGGE